MTEPLARVDVGRRPDGRVVVAVAGEIDLSNAADVERRVDDAARIARGLVVDLTALEYLDSQGVRVLQHLVNRHVEGAVDLTIVATRRSMAGDVLAITRITDAVPVVERLD
jgi:anti-anti-sigma factor